MATYERLTYGSPDGAMLGNVSSEPIGFWGATPTTRPSSANQAVVTTTQVANVTTVAAVVDGTNYAYTTSSQANAISAGLAKAKADINNINVLLTEIRSALVTVGIIHGS